MMHDDFELDYEPDFLLKHARLDLEPTPDDKLIHSSYIRTKYQQKMRVLIFFLGNFGEYNTKEIYIYINKDFELIYLSSRRFSYGTAFELFFLIILVQEYKALIVLLNKERIALYIGNILLDMAQLLCPESLTGSTHDIQQFVAKASDQQFKKAGIPTKYQPFLRKLSHVS